MTFFWSWLARKLYPHIRHEIYHGAKIKLTLEPWAAELKERALDPSPLDLKAVARHLGMFKDGKP